MAVRRCWRTLTAAGLALLILGGPGWAQGAPVRQSGIVAAVDRSAGTITIESVGPWQVRDGLTVTTRVTVKPEALTAWARARRAQGAGPSGWEGEFIEVPQGAWEVKTGEYVTIQLDRAGDRQVATRVTVSEFDTR